MSGDYPDGVNQASFDRYWENKLGDDSEAEREAQRTANQRQREWLSEVLQKPLLEATLEDNSQTLRSDLDKLRDLQKQLAAALRECLEDYCIACGFGKQGCSSIHHIHCRMLKLLEKAEGRKLKLNMEPEEE